MHQDVGTNMQDLQLFMFVLGNFKDFGAKNFAQSGNSTEITKG